MYRVPHSSCVCSTLCAVRSIVVVSDFHYVLSPSLIVCDVHYVLSTIHVVCDVLYVLRAKFLLGVVYIMY